MKQGSIHLRPATVDDAPLLRRWDGQPHVIAAKSDEDWHWETELANRSDWRESLIAEVDGRPIGFVDIIDAAREETHYWGDVPEGLRAIDIWIGEPEYLGRGYGTAMMQCALERCFADPSVTAVLIDRKSTRLNSSHVKNSYAVFCWKKTKKPIATNYSTHYDHSR